MSYAVAAPELMASAASDLANIGSAVTSANAAAAAPTAKMLAAGADEVSAAMATLFSGHGQAFQALSAKAAEFHSKFVQALNSAGSAYVAAEAANVSPLAAVVQGAQSLAVFSSVAAASGTGAQLMSWQHLPQSLPGQVSATFNGTRIAVPGAAPGLLTGSETPQQYAALNVAIGENWFPGTTPEVVNYPATDGLISGLFKPTTNESIAIGQQMLNTDILNATAGNHSVVVTGLSEGTIVIDREQAYLATAPNAPSPSQVTFVEFANPQRGLADTFFHSGTIIRGLGYTVAEPPVSQYNTDVVYSQYDGFADPPDRPWHLLADVNALAGFQYLHTPTELASPSQAVEVCSVTNSLGGTTTTYMIPTSTLPMLMPLQQIGVPAPIVSALNNLLTPIVNEGYSQFDPTGGPYFSQGNLVW